MRKTNMQREGSCRAKRPYQAILWTRSGLHSWDVAATRLFRTREAARRQCQRWMHSHRVYETRCLPARMPPFADVRDVRRNVMLESFDAEVVLVESVGERGVW